MQFIGEYVNPVQNMTACQSLTTVELIQAAILARDDVETMLVVIIFLISRSFQKYVTTYGLQLVLIPIKNHRK